VFSATWLVFKMEIQSKDAVHATQQLVSIVNICMTINQAHYEKTIKELRVNEITNICGLLFKCKIAV